MDKPLLKILPFRAQRSLIALHEMFQLCWKSQPLSFAMLTLFEVTKGLLPLGIAWLTKSIFDQLARQIEAEKTIVLAADFLPSIGGLAALMLLSQIVTPLARAIQQDLGRQLTLAVEMNVYAKINSIHGLEPFEDPELYSIIGLTSQYVQQGPMQILAAWSVLTPGLISLIGFIGLVTALSPVLASIVALSMLPQLYAQLRLGWRRFGLMVKNTHQEQFADYCRSVLSLVDFAKEVRLFNVGEYFLSRLQQTVSSIMKQQRAQSRQELAWQLGLSTLSTSIAVGALIYVVQTAFTGQITIGDVALYITAVAVIQSTLLDCIFAIAGLYEGVLFHHQYSKLMHIKQPVAVVSPSLSVPPLRDEIRFCNVSFRYSDEHHWVLHGVNLSITAGKCTALVGLNGAGKTTLVKLLARFYDPTGGIILWDGVDIRQFDPTSLRQRLGAIFQDFVQYNLTAHENIALGDIRFVADRQRVVAAALQAGADAAIRRLPRDYDTLLSRWLAGDNPDAVGAELSGGEWQKVALARLFMRDADVLILDEPTAALDAQAEYELYQRFRTLMAGRTSLLIAHRFSTVRMADLIAVLEDGRITEVGSHATLVVQNGTYAQLYAKQAAPFQSSIDTP